MIKKENLFAAILSGGIGTRFWPLSRRKNPKQFLNIVGDKPLIEQTFDRLKRTLPSSQLIFVITQDHFDLLKGVFPEIKRDNIIIEPIGRNTAPCIGLLLCYILARSEDPLLGIFPSDHYVVDLEKFNQTISFAYQLAEHGSVVTLGITPTAPHTGFGYIQYDKTNPVAISENKMAFKANQFCEKPNHDKAVEYYNSGNFLWNSGMFFFHGKMLLELYKKHLPEVYAGLCEIMKYIGTEDEWRKIKEIFPKFPSISIDYGIAEKLNDILVIPSDFGWDDLGSWESFYSHNPKDESNNVTLGDVIYLNSQNNIIFSNKGLIAVVGLNDTVIINSDNATLICARSESQQVRKIVEAIEKRKWEDYL